MGRPPDMEGGPAHHRPPEAATAKRQAQRYLTTADRLEVQLPLFAEAIPAHRLAPAEADLRRFVNTQPPGRFHWWLYTWEGRHQRAYLERIGRWAA